VSYKYLNLLIFIFFLEGCAIKVDDFKPENSISSGDMVRCMQQPVNHQHIIRRDNHHNPIVQNDSVTNCLDRESELSIKKIDQSISISKSKKIIDKPSNKETKKEFNKELEKAADEKEFENLKKSIDKKIN